MSTRTLSVQHLKGLTEYKQAHKLQLRSVEHRKQNAIGDTLYLLEHPPVLTTGRNADNSGIVAPGETLSKMGIQSYHIERGGQTTYHGPGQLVGYPIIDLHHWKIGIKDYVHGIEQVMINAAAAAGVPAGRRDDATGVFAQNETGGKIGALGIRVSRGIAFHGFAINLEPDLSHYNLIIPCGLAQTPVTSINALAATKISMENFRIIVEKTFLSVFNAVFNS